jgi:hypothetical protein
VLKTNLFTQLIPFSVVAALLLSACSTPTLVEIARRRQATDEDRRAGYDVKDDVRIQYFVTDWDVLNFTDEVKRKLANRASLHIGFSYGTAGTNATLGALAGAAQTLGWGVATASGFGLGATYVFGMSQIFQSKGQAQAYEQSFTQIQAAEATFYFHQLGMSFDPKTGKVDPGNPIGRSDIPSRTNLTPDGETLYYRASKILKVLNDTLAGKIPDLQDLKEANGESAGSSPAKSIGAPPVRTLVTDGPTGKPPPPSHQFAETAVLLDRIAKLQNREQINAIYAAITGHPPETGRIAKIEILRIIREADANGDAATLQHVRDAIAAKAFADDVVKMSPDTLELLGQVARLQNAAQLQSIYLLITGHAPPPGIIVKNEDLRLIKLADSNHDNSKIQQVRNALSGTPVPPATDLNASGVSAPTKATDLLEEVGKLEDATRIERIYSALTGHSPAQGIVPKIEILRLIKEADANGDTATLQKAREALAE